VSYTSTLSFLFTVIDFSSAILCCLFLQSHSPLTEPIDIYQVIISFQSLNCDEQPNKLPGYENIYDMASRSIFPKQQICSNCWQCDTARYAK